MWKWHEAEGLLRCKPRWQGLFRCIGRPVHRGCSGAQWLHTSRPQACSGGRRPAACAGASNLKAGTRQILLPALSARGGGEDAQEQRVRRHSAGRSRGCTQRGCQLCLRLKLNFIADLSARSFCLGQSVIKLARNKLHRQQPIKFPVY